MNLRARLHVLLLASFGFAGIASAATFSLNPTADAFVSSNTALNALGTATISNSNYGAAGAIGAAAAGLPKGEFDSLLKFDLSSAKASFDATFGAGLWAINSMSLQLTLASPGNAIFNGNGAGAGGTNINFAGSFAMKWMQNDSWVEGAGTPSAPTLATGTGSGITFSALPSFLSGPDELLGSFSYAGATSGNITLSLGLTPSFVADATAGNNVSLLMLPNDTGVALLANSITAAVANRPQLTVGAIPEPCAAALAIVGALGCLAQRRRHARKA